MSEELLVLTSVTVCHWQSHNEKKERKRRHLVPREQKKELLVEDIQNLAASLYDR